MFEIMVAFGTSLLLCFFSIPVIIKIAKLKHLFDEPDERKQHKEVTPTLGGLAIFSSCIVSVTFWARQGQWTELQYIISALLILFFLGLKDDIIGVAPWKKLVIQLIAIGIVVHLGGVRLNTFYGIFGIGVLPDWLSYIFSTFLILVITNSFNLIDGIDGLAGSVGFLSTLVFGSWFYLLNLTHYSILSFSLAGTLLAFLFYNRSPAKIFMGDTGSLITGLIIAVSSVRFIEYVRLLPPEDEFKISSSPVFTLAVLIVPLFDTLRVFSIRILNGTNPFKADRKHLHYILIDLGFSHMQATATLISFNIAAIVFCYVMQGFNAELLIAILLFSAMMLTSFASYLLNKKRARIARLKRGN